MKACGVASSIGGGALAVALALGACRSAPHGEIPPVTVAHADPNVPLFSGPIADASLAPNGPALVAAPAHPSPASASASAVVPASEPPVKVQVVDLPTKLEDGLCQTTLLAVVSGSMTAMDEKLGPGDVLVITNAAAGNVTGWGTIVEARTANAPCPVRARPAPEKTVVRATAAPKLAWAGGKLSAHVDVGTKVSPSVYLGRLEAGADVPEHAHPTSWEFLVATQPAGGVLTVNGKELRPAPKQVVAVPPGTKHSWKPDPGGKLVALQLYAPPGPEQRFFALASAAKDAGAPDAAPHKDAGKP